MSDAPHRFTIDRFEGRFAVVEVDGERVLDLPRWMLPDGTREDDVLVVTPRRERDGVLGLEIRIDAEATHRAREESRRLVRRLREKDPGGDLTL